MVIMQNIKKIPSQYVVPVVVLMACALVAGFLGWISINKTADLAPLLNEKKATVLETPFVLQSAPNEKGGLDEHETVIDPAQLRIWEITARQALPPRKEPLTPPRWRIVGVTTVGEEKSVLLLFADQPAPETLKIGEKLPGGAKIVQISQDHLQISLNGQLMKLNLRKQ
jgi:hypothetical protein